MLVQMNILFHQEHNLLMLKFPLYKEKEQMDLSFKESELVSFLVQNRGFFVSIETLHERIWENKEISYADIRMCIKRVREKTCKDFIKTKRFVGYKIDK